MEPRGILRNKSESKTEEQEFDRQQVILNTQMNAKLASESHDGDQIRAKLAAQHNGSPPDHLKWDEINLYKTEQEKAATMKIDEPKTPYEGGFDPQGEYYRDDDEEPIPDFSLGAGEFDSEHEAPQSMNGGEVVAQEESEASESEEEQPLSAEERHKRFEAMRKAHYHNAANPLKHHD